jgi:hypothetical protein
MIMVLLTPLQPVGGTDTVRVTVVLRLSPWDPLAKSDFKVYVNGSSSPFGTELSVSTSKSLVFEVPKESRVRISGELEVLGDYGFWYRLESVNGSGRSIEFIADRDVVVYLNYSTNHVLSSPYFILVYILVALLIIRERIRK